MQPSRIPSSLDELRLASGSAVPRIILGTANLGSPLPDPLISASARGGAFDLLDGLLDIGCTAFDTAASYMLGGTERLLGAWMRSHRNRDRLFVISKGGHPLPVLRPNRVTAGDLAADLHSSLRRLDTDHLDLYLVHRDHPASALEPILEALTGFQRSGKIRAYGVSNWHHSRVQALAELARTRGEPSVAASSPHFSLAEWVTTPWPGSVSIAGVANRQARAFHERTQLPVLAYSALGSGYFGGRTERAYDCSVNQGKRARADTLAKRHGVSPSEIALAYLCNQPFPVHAVTAVSTVAHMLKNLAAAALHLSGEELRFLELGDAT